MRVTITAHPNSRKPRVEKDLFNELHIYVSEPPLEGKANRAVAESLANHYKVPKSKVKLLKGEKSKIKVFEIGN
ncbi:MAG TPA: DUF167 domain-containing protein [Patescibacteria group bacterium]